MALDCVFKVVLYRAYLCPFCYAQQVPHDWLIASLLCLGNVNSNHTHFFIGAALCTLQKYPKFQVPCLQASRSSRAGGVDTAQDVQAATDVAGSFMTSCPRIYTV